MGGCVRCDIRVLAAIEAGRELVGNLADQRLDVCLS
jgi:hypothetical protein